MNPDEIEQGIRDRGFLDFAQHGVAANGPEVLQFFRDSDFLAKAGLMSATHDLRFSNGQLEFGRVEVNSYMASVAVDFLSQKLLAQKTSFTLETVMSHPSKVALLARAQMAQWRGWLGIDGTVALSKPTASSNGMLDGPVVNLEADPVFQELMAEGLAMQHRFAAEPIFAKIGKGFLISEGVAELERLKASSESDRRRLPVVSGQYAAD